MTTPRPPGPRGFLGNGHLLLVRRHPRSFQQLARRHGDLVYFRVGSREIFLVSRPSLIERIFHDHYTHFEKDWGPRSENSVFENGLLTSEGAQHKSQRQEFSRIFSRSSIEGQRAAVDEILHEWSESRHEGERIDLFDAMSRLSARVASRAQFGCSLDTDKLLESTEAVVRGFRRFMFPHAGKFRFGVDRGDGIREMIARIREHAGRHDSPDCLFRTLLDRSPHGTDAMLATFLVAGQEAIRSATSISWWLLSRNPEAARRLELEARESQARGLSRYPYAEAVLSESLRLYPPQWMIGRRAIAPYDLDGYEVPPGALVLLSPYIVQREERWFPDPEKFDPQRWLGANAGPSERFAYFPFGGGPRRCIGESFAMIFGSATLSTIARDWRFECEEREPAWDVRLTMHPRSVNAVVRRISRENDA